MKRVDRAAQIAGAAEGVDPGRLPVPHKNWLKREPGELREGDVIERRQLQQFGGDLYTPYLIKAVRPDKFYGEPLTSKTHEPMWFARDQHGRTWRR